MSIITPTPEPPSADFSKFDYAVLFDLSGPTPTVKLTNQSVGTNLAGCEFWFEIFSGGGIVFHQGSELSLDANGNWTVINISEPLPEVLGHIEWSGGDFVVKGYIKDSINQIFQTDKQVRICRPNGNKSETKNNYGAGSLYVETKCESARLYVEDRSNYGYGGKAGIIFSKAITVIYPPDATGTIPSPKVANNSNAVLIPIWYSSDGYRATLDTVYTYDFGNSVFVRIKYRANVSFPVLCNIDLCPIIAYIEKMEQEYESQGCTAEEREKMNLIQYKLTRVMMAKMQPLCGMDIGKTIDDIKRLGGIQCEHNENQSNGILPLYESGGGLDCDGVKECLNEDLNDLDPGCIASEIEWQGMSYKGKMAAIVAGLCAAGVEDVDVRIDFPYKVYSLLLSFDAGTGNFTIKNLRNDFGNTTFAWTRSGNTFILTASNPVFTANKTVLMPASIPAKDLIPIGITTTTVNIEQYNKDGAVTGYTGFTDLFLEVRVYS